MEYTDAPITETETAADIQECPFCGTPLPKGATKCTNCDWTRDLTNPGDPRASDAMAIFLSIIPGLGHIYKGHKVMGAVLMLLVTPVAVAFGFLAAFASAGFGIGMLVFYWLAVMLHAWGIKDYVTETTDEGEQY
jgi:uncharacterized membrane protein YphA (DoxX/SURF4 family)